MQKAVGLHAFDYKASIPELISEGSKDIIHPHPQRWGSIRGRR